MIPNTIEELKVVARGRWTEILSSAGIPSEALNGRNHPCPKCGGRDRFAVFKDFQEAGGCNCRSCFDKGNDGLATLQWYMDCDFPTAKKWLVDYLGMNSNGRRAGNGQAKGKPAKTFATAEEAVVSIERRKGKRSATWVYHNAKGEPVGVVVRWDKGGEKTFRPVSRTDNGKWFQGGMTGPRPLYYLPEILKTDATIYIVEGEKAADAARYIGLVATTSPHGSKSANKANWSPLTGRSVVILPDNDDVGEAYAKGVVGILAKLTPPAAVRVIRLPDLPDKGDVDDFVSSRREAGSNNAAIRDEIEKLTEAADVIAPEPQKPVVAKRAIVKRLADVEPQEVDWLWPGRVAIGKLTILSGDPGLGKSFVTLDIAARVSQGESWPDDSSTTQPAGGVVLLSAEDDLSDTIRPRLDAAGADVNRIVSLEAVTYSDAFGDVRRPADLIQDLEHIETAIDAAGDCRLVVVDPISAFMGGTDSHKNADVRAVLARLAELADRKRVAVIAVSHLTKGDGAAIYRTMGSLAFVAAARAAWAVVKDKADPQKRLMLPLKNNLAPDVDGLAYRIEDSTWGGCPSVSWYADPVTVSVDEAMERPERKRGPEPEATDDASDWLAKTLASGPRPATELFDEGTNGEGFSKRTIERAKVAIEVKAYRPKVPGPWWWKMPDQHRQDEPQDKQLGDLGGLGDFGGLSDETVETEAPTPPRPPSSLCPGNGGDVGNDWGEI